MTGSCENVVERRKVAAGPPRRPSVFKDSLLGGD